MRLLEGFRLCNDDSFIGGYEFDTSIGLECYVCPIELIWLFSVYCIT